MTINNKRWFQLFVDCLLMIEENDSALSSHALSHLKAIGKTDILVGIPSYNNVLTASHVISQVVKGLETYFPDMRLAIFVSDGNSVDGTLTAVKTVQLPSKVNLIPAVYVGVSGKGSAIKAIFEAAQYLEARSVALVDSDLRSITPEWMKLLINPTLTGTGFVAPLYNRRKYDGTITNFLCYPVTAGLFGKNIRQPIGGDFGLSIELVEALLRSPLWRMREVRRFGVDIFETHSALAKEFEVKQAFLGVKEHEAKDPYKHLGSMFREVTGTLFACAELYETAWRGIRGVSEIEIVGEVKHVNNQAPIPIDLQGMIDVYVNGFGEHLQVYRSILSNEVLEEFKKLKALEKTELSFSMDTWAKTVYTFIAAFHKAAPSERGGLVDALQILWFGRLAAFVKESWAFDPEKTEKKIREQAQAFVKFKPYLIDIY
jgi:glycosyltransferase involved in cell wall biosynthesis